MNNYGLTKDSTEEEIGKILESVRKGVLPRSILLELLSERNIVYVERPSYQITRIKGFTLASFFEVGLPDSATNFILDELQNGRNAYLVGAAARGLRGAKQPRTQYVCFLIQAIYNLKYHDDSFDLSVFKPEWPLQDPSNGRLEILKTFQWLKGYAKAAIPDLKSFLDNRADFTPEMIAEIRRTIEEIEQDQRELDLSCCESEIKSTSSNSWLWKSIRNINNIGNLMVQNEDGLTQSLEDVIDHKPTVITFFYTRCMNPNKCTLTINKIGWLQNKLAELRLEHKVNLLAFTYDPNHDTPSKMRAFAENRGLKFDSNTHVLRTQPEEFRIISDFFQLGVNHVASTVNQHRLELFILNQNGSIQTTYTRLQWELDSVVSDLVKLDSSKLSRNIGFKILNFIQQVIFPVVMVFFSKMSILLGCLS